MPRAALLAAALLVSAQAWASAPLSPPPVGAQAQAEALAAMVIPAELLARLQVEWGRRRFIAGFEMDALGKRMIAAEPGMPAAIWAAVEPEYRKRGVESWPSFRQQLAAHYAARLTPAELAAARTFYATATGRKVIAGVYRNSEIGPALDYAAATGDVDGARKAFGAARAEAGDRAGGTFTAEDEPAFGALTRTLPLEKFRSVELEVQKFTLDWVNEEDPAFRSRVDRILEAAIRRYIEKHPDLPRQ